MSEPKIERFENRSKELTAKISDLEHKSIVLSCLRFFTFVAAVACGVFGFVYNLPQLLIGAACMLIAFVVLCIVHGKVLSDLKFNTALYSVNAKYIYRITGDFEGLYETSMAGYSKSDEKALNAKINTGEEFYKLDHDYCQDFSLFGKKSIFTLLNTSETVMGRNKFAHGLLYASVEENKDASIPTIQEAVKEISSDMEFLQQFQATAMQGALRYTTEDMDTLFETLTPMSKAKKIIYKIIPLLWLIPLAFIFIDVTLVRPILFGVIIVNLIFWGVGLVKNKEIIPSSLTIRKFCSLRDLYSILEQKEFNSEYLRKLVSCGNTSAKTSEILGKLCSILNLANLRSQPLFALILNAVFPLDHLVYELLTGWNEKYGKKLGSVIDNIGDIEYLSSLSQMTLTADEYVYPSFIDSISANDNAYFEGTDICHPLLYPDTRVSNSVTLNSNIALITGSNMSGKTTLIRTVGICALLAYMGGPVPAKELTLGKMRIISSMRIVDSLEENMSTFKAELVRISGIVSAGREGDPILFLIDEIFRGTNSDDRTAGALTVLKNLSKPHICGMMTTHDYALIDITENKLGGIVYYHFSESYSDTGILFDYKLRSGISRSSNAQFLMKLVGIDKGDEQ